MNKKKIRPHKVFTYYLQFFFIFGLYFAISRALMHFSFKKFAKLNISLYICSGIGGEIPNHRCISLLFRTYRKDLGNHFGIVRFKKQRETHKRRFPLQPLFSYAHAFGVVHSYKVVGVPIPRSAPQVSA